MTPPFKTPDLKQSILSPEKVEINVKYTFSINPNDDYQFWNDTEAERVKKATNHITWLCRKYCNIYFELFMDVSRVGRIHWHGTILFNNRLNIKQFFTEIIHDLTLKHTIEMDTIADPKKWLEYCTKTKHLWDNTVSTRELMKKYLRKELPVKYKDYFTEPTGGSLPAVASTAPSSPQKKGPINKSSNLSELKASSSNITFYDTHEEYLEAISAEERDLCEQY